jgi:hypothetical protein
MFIYKDKIRGRVSKEEELLYSRLMKLVPTEPQLSKLHRRRRTFPRHSLGVCDVTSVSDSVSVT